MFELDPIEAEFLRELALAAIEDRLVTAPSREGSETARRARRRLRTAGLADSRRGERRLAYWRITPAGLDLLVERYAFMSASSVFEADNIRQMGDKGRSATKKAAPENRSRP